MLLKQDSHMRSIFILSFPRYLPKHLNIPFICLNSSDSFLMVGSIWRYSRGASLELGRPSSSHWWRWRWRWRRMKAFPLSLKDSLITKRNKGVRNEWIIKANTPTIWWNRWYGSEETGEEHSIWESGFSIKRYIGHSFSHVVSQIEGLSSGDTK